MDIITEQFIIKYSTYTGVGKTDKRWYDDVFIVVDYCTEVSVGRNISPDEVSCEA